MTYREGLTAKVANHLRDFQISAEESKDAVSFRCNIVDVGFEFKVKGKSNVKVCNRISTLERVVM